MSGLAIGKRELCVLVGVVVVVVSLVRCLQICGIFVFEVFQFR